MYFCLKILAFLALFCATAFAQGEKNTTSTGTKIFDRLVYRLVINNIEATHIDPMESLFVYLSACGARSAMLSNEYNSNRFDGLSFIVLPDKQGDLNAYLLYIKRF